MEKTELPVHGAHDHHQWQCQRSHKRGTGRVRRHFLILTMLAVLAVGVNLHLARSANRSTHIPANATYLRARCNNLKLSPGPPVDFVHRTTSDRFDVGTKPVLIRNATIWTGQLNGLEIIKGDIFLDKGIIKEVGRVGLEHLNAVSDLVTFDAEGAWVTPGCASFILLPFMCKSNGPTES